MVKEGRGAYPVKKVEFPPPPANIRRIGALKRYPDSDYAKSLLYEAARLVAPIIHEYKFEVCNVYEMFPSNSNLLGLNVNHGQKILIRLRPHYNDRSFLPMNEIVGTFLHELAHNKFGPHDKKFYDFLDKLKERYEDIHYRGASTNYYSEENKLGRGGLPSSNLVSVREKRIKELSKQKFKTESKVLGLLSHISKGPARPADLRKAMLEAAERRLRDAKWCHSEHAEEEQVPEDDELDIAVVDKDEFEKNGGANCPPLSLADKNVPKPARKHVPKEIEVIDLTSDTEEVDSKIPEVIVID
ncbi:DNA-dependent metalloprotease WSS1 [Candida viswanathii]|uniref:DNA-dependent metalloprotease WSS1 n=1 Tax=Candida viswanathii TaxID=5486 RepID=A0A367XXE5_9ASCO|nr:DNA-dependent metalloprotease WSS1 [Candida viswanathii]